MDNSYLYGKTGVQLKQIAKQEGIKLPSGAAKARMIELIIAAREERGSAEAAQQPEATQQPEAAQPKEASQARPKQTAANAVDVPADAGAGETKAQKAQPAPEAAAAETPAPETPALETHVKEAPAPRKRSRSRKQPKAEEAPAGEKAEAPASEAADEPSAAQEKEAAEPEPVDDEDLASDVSQEEADASSRIPEAPAGDWGEGRGVLEIMPDGYGFLRADNCLPGSRDVYLSQMQIRRFNLRSGDYITGKTRPVRDGDRYEGMIFVSTVNGLSADAARRRPRFEDLTPVFPDRRLRLENPLGNTDLALRTIDLVAPIGKGQRGLIVSPPKAGKTVLLKKIANAITQNNPETQLIVLLIDERPEEVTDMQRSTTGEVLYSTFDEAPENHTRLSEMVLEKAMRQVELGRDVVILLDSITRLARAYNLVIPPTGRSLSGGLDPGALYKPKKFFGAARNIENGGSLTIIATALVDTGSRMDDIIYEEFKGTGNMELHLDRKLSERRVFPAIELNRSGTRRDELLYTPQEAAGALQIRRMLAGANNIDATEQLISLMEKTKDNAELIVRMKGWLAALSR
ncbi:MAG: transcription termination factor Rho [Clostridiales bacterium]|nr:transcription termination factor Rho [Clostridiales bacterium]